MSTAVLEKTQTIDRDLAGIAYAAKQNYQAALARVARGESLPPDEIHAACVADGRSVAQFQADVVTMRQRLRALAALETENATREQHKALYKVAADIMEEIKKLDSDYKKRRDELANSYIHADRDYKVAAAGLQDEIGQAHQTLRNTAANPNGNVRDLHNVKLSD